MAATFVEKEILTYRIELALQPRNQHIIVTIDRNSNPGSWRVYLPSYEEFSIQDLIDICTAVYDSEVFEEDYTYILECDSWKDCYYIRGKKKVASCILEQFKIPFPKKKEENK